MRSLVATGAGIALLPDLVYRPWSLEGDRIEWRDISGALPVVQVGMVWRQGLEPAAAGARFHRPRAAPERFGVKRAMHSYRKNRYHHF